MIKEKELRYFEGWFAGCNITIGFIIVIIGMKHLPPAVVLNTPSKKSDPCPNGAAYYLFVAGIIMLATNFFLLLSKLTKYCTGLYCSDTEARPRTGQSGYRSPSETEGTQEGIWIHILNIILGAVVIVDYAHILWGSYVVFGAWSRWTDDYEKYAEEPRKYNYCSYHPIVAAFVILIIKWVTPVLLPLLGCCVFLISCFCFFPGYG